MIATSAVNPAASLMTASPSVPSNGPTRSVLFADRLGAALAATSDPPSPDSPTPQNPTVGRIVARAASALPSLPGLPAGIDSAEIVARAHRHVGVQVPMSAGAQTGLGASVPSLDAARAGDVLVLAQPGDVALYLGDGKMVSVVEPGQGPTISRVDPVSVADIRRLVTDAPTTVPNLVGAPGTAGISVGSLRPASVSASSIDPLSVRQAAAPFAAFFEAAGREHQIDPALLTAVASVESAFDPAAVSGAGAQGLMQFMPATASSFGIDPLDPGQAAGGAARYLRQMLDRFGSLELALAGYNAGPGAVSRAGGVPPYPETRAYVTKVLDTYEVLR
ncbi:MAG: transglycosylase SLT domain-containing protein [Actinomycetia bacterium]|nr:transglycosylase SLT domain-containing protein [Actinomycetes bacterium]